MYLGIDIGTSSIKMLLIGSDSLKHTAIPLPSEDYKQDPGIIKDCLIRAINQWMNQSELSVIRGIGLCGHGPSVLFIGKTGTPLTPILTWQDRRAYEEAKLIKKEFAEFYKDATCYEAKVLWFYRNHPDVFDQNSKVLYPKDYIIYELTGRAVIDESAASTVHFYDRHKKQWEFHKLGIPNSVFPEVVSSWEQVEVTGTTFSRQCGLPDGIPVYAGGIDAFCEAIGAGAIKHGQMVEGTGTSTCISTCCPEEPTLALHVIPSSSINITPLSYTGGSIKWINSIVANANEEQGLEVDLKPDQPVKLLFLPYLIGERSPIWDQKARGVFVGLTNTTDKRSLMQAVLQGIGFAIRQNVGLLQQENTETIRAVGGGSQNLAWLQMKADITGKVYEKLEIIDSAALGSALLAAFGQGERSLDDLVSEWVKVERVFYPDTEAQKKYQELFNIYEQVYPTLKNIMHKIADLEI